MYGIVDIVYEFERNKCIVGVLMAFGRFGLECLEHVVSWVLILLLWLLVWPGWIPGLFWLKDNREREFWGCRIYRGNAAEISVAYKWTCMKN